MSTHRVSHVGEKVEESKTCPALGCGRHTADATTRLNKYRRQSLSWMNGKVIYRLWSKDKHIITPPLVGHVSDVMNGGEEGSIQLSIHLPPSSLHSISVFASSSLYWSCPSYLSTAIFLPPSLFLFVTHSSEMSFTFLSFSFAFSPPRLSSDDPLLLQALLFSLSSCLPLILSLSSFSTSRFLLANAFFFLISKAALEAWVCEGWYIEHTAAFFLAPFSLPHSSDRKQTLTRPPLGTQRLFRHSMLQAKIT